MFMCIVVRQRQQQQQQASLQKLRSFLKFVVKILTISSDMDMKSTYIVELIQN